MTSLAAGATLCDGRYRLDEVVGRGGMASVWRATDLQLEREVAIKVISEVLAGDPRFVARFEREARIAASLNHPNLVKVFDFSVDTERPFLVMEYVSGGTLTDARGDELDLDSLAHELLAAVAHIHSAGILHRDIKPANVLLGPNGSPRLTDFGIARGEESTSLTQTGQVLGTLRYIAPEVVAGRPATPRSDLYSLGVLLGDLEGPPTSTLAALIERMSSRDPAKRPGSAADALAELDPTAILADTRPLPPAGSESAVAYFVRRPRFSGSRIAIVVLLLFVVLGIVVAAASGGGSALDVKPLSPSQFQPAPAGAPADQQLRQLEHIVQAAPGN